jgi:dipeptidyl aminopeptidase/acylaminoacyl peptidase
MTSGSQLLILLTGSSLATAQTVAGKRPITVRDIIHSADFPGGYGSYIPSAFSRDKSRFVIAVQRPNIEKNAVVGHVLVFRVADVFTKPKPDTIATFSSTSNKPPIADMRWLGDTAVILRGEQPNKPSQIYVVNVTTRAARVVSHSRTGVNAFALSPDESRVAYIADRSPDSAELERRATKGFLVTQAARDLLAGNFTMETEDDSPERMVSVSLRSGKETEVTGLAMGNCSGSPTISPDSRFAMIECWYYGSVPSDLAYFAKWARDRGQPLSYAVVADLDRNVSYRLFDAPAWLQSEHWSKDNKTVLIVNGFLPTVHLSEQDRAAQQVRRGAYIVNPATRELTFVVQRDSLLFVSWDGPRIVLRSTASDNEELTFEKRGPSWSLTGTRKMTTPAPSRWARPGDTAATGELKITIDQDLNTPRRVVAVKDGKRGVIYDPNPQYSQLAFGKVEAIRWRSSDGEWEGGLYYPVGYTPGKRYPLVVQTHGYNPDNFQIEGYDCHTGYVAQALTGQGVVVLQFGYPRGGFQSMNNNPDEPAIDARGMQSAIDTLVARGLVDPSKVALQGWSRSTWPVRYFLANYKHPIRAALISDGVDYSYLRYLIDSETLRADFELTNTAVPIGEGLLTWQKRVPTLNADKMNAPIRIEAIAHPHGGGPLTQWELYTLLKRLGKPVEMIYYPRGTHDLVHPQERLTSQGGALDWFLFWLKDYRDPDPAKAEQYRRWEAMKR